MRSLGVMIYVVEIVKEIRFLQQEKLCSHPRSHCVPGDFLFPDCSRFLQVAHGGKFLFQLYKGALGASEAPQLIFLPKRKGLGGTRLILKAAMGVIAEAVFVRNGDKLEATAITLEAPNTRKIIFSSGDGIDLV